MTEETKNRKKEENKERKRMMEENKERKRMTEENKERKKQIRRTGARRPPLPAGNRRSSEMSDYEIEIRGANRTRRPDQPRI